MMQHGSGRIRPRQCAGGAAAGELSVIRTTTFGLPVGWLAVAVVLGAVPAITAQKTQSAPVTDSAAQASPIQSNSGPGVSVAPHTQIELKLGRTIDSGHLQNGEAVAATLAKP